MKHTPSSQCLLCHLTQWHGQRVFQGKNYWFEWTLDGISDTRMFITPDDGNMIVISDVLELCLGWLARNDRFDDLTSGEKVATRALIGHQLHEVRLSMHVSQRFLRHIMLTLCQVDYWLLHQRSMEAAQEVILILMEFVEPEREMIPREPSLEHRWKRPIAGIRTLLLYRAVLFAALCALVPDTSCVFDTELGRRVVQVL